MARIPLIDENARADLAETIARIRGARGGRLLNFYRVLLHSPGLASAWLDFNNAVRYGNALDERLRELVIMRVAALNRTGYVFAIHRERYAAPAGVTPREVDALSEPGAAGSFGARDAALIAYVDAVTRDVDVPKPVFNSLRTHFSDREIVEITVLIAAYNMHTRVLKALDIDPER